MFHWLYGNQLEKVASRVQTVEFQSSILEPACMPPMTGSSLYFGEHRQKIIHFRVTLMFLVIGILRSQKLKKHLFSALPCLQMGKSKPRRGRSLPCTGGLGECECRHSLFGGCICLSWGWEFPCASVKSLTQQTFF